jgi:hypothetical protein
MSTIETQRKERSDREYRELRAQDPDLFRKCVEMAQGILFNHHAEIALLTDAQRLRLAAAIETRLVSIAVRTLR